MPNNRAYDNTDVLLNRVLVGCNDNVIHKVYLRVSLLGGRGLASLGPSGMQLPIFFTPG